MAQVINTNVGALFAGAALQRSSHDLLTAQQRLSSGLRINSAADDATGLVTATNLDKNIRGNEQTLLNLNDAIGTSQTMDGYLGQLSENLQRLNEIAVRNGGTAGGDEATALSDEVTRLGALALATTGVDVNGSTVGGNATAALSITVTGSSTTAQLTTALDAVNTQRAQYGADIAEFNSAIASLETANVNLSASYSRIMDTDYAKETAELARNNILQQAGTSMLAQANQTPQTVLSLLQ